MKSSVLKYQWPSKFSATDRRALTLIANREERGFWGLLDYDEIGLVHGGDPTRWSTDLKLKVEKLHDLFEEELKQSGLGPAPFLFPPEQKSQA
jgi:hypothetical protein